MKQQIQTPSGNSKSQPWMLFRTEHSMVHYFWDGKFPYFVFSPDGDHNKHYWCDMNASMKEVITGTKDLMNEVAGNKRKKLFTIKDHKQRYIVVQRGIFETEL